MMTYLSINRFSIGTICRSYGGTKIDQEKRWLFVKYKVKEKVRPFWIRLSHLQQANMAFALRIIGRLQKIVERPMNDRVILLIIGRKRTAK